MERPDYLLVDHGFIYVGCIHLLELPQVDLYDHSVFATGECQNEAFNSVLRVAGRLGCSSELIRRIRVENGENYQGMAYCYGWESEPDDFDVHVIEYGISLFWNDPPQMKLDSRLLRSMKG